MSVVPSVFAGCWKLVTVSSSTPFLRIAEGGPYHTSDGAGPFTVSPDGLTLDWWGTVFTRHLGSGQTLLGVWRAGGDEYYFRDDRSFTYRDAATEIPGVFDTLGNDACGTLIAWEQRAVIAQAVDNGDGSYTVTAYSAFGANDTFAMRLDGPRLVIEASSGQSFEYDPVSCQTLT